MLGDVMKYISLLIILCCVTVNYAAENRYDRIVNAVNNSPNLAAQRRKTFQHVQDIIYQRSSSEINQKQLRQLTVPELNLLLKEIKNRFKAVQILEKSKDAQAKDISELERLSRLECIVESECKKWREKFVYNENKKDHDHIYEYHQHYY